MNIPLICLWVICVGTIITVVVLSVLALNKWNRLNIVVVPKSKDKCIIPLDGPNDASKYDCCVLSGAVTQEKYYPPLDMVISPVSKFTYLEVCSGFCPNGLNSDDNTKCADPATQENQDALAKCISATEPTDCIGRSKPVAYQGLNYYYAFAATDASCPETTTCA